MNKIGFWQFGLGKKITPPSVTEPEPARPPETEPEGPPEYQPERPPEPPEERLTPDGVDIF